MKSNSLLQVNTTPVSQLGILVENRTTFEMNSCQLNVFETHKSAEKVELLFDDLVITSMLRGKKVMHLPGKTAFDYFPGESVVIQPKEKMTIDFPVAELHDPTQCIALAISPEEIKTTVDLLNERFPKENDLNPWTVDMHYFHLENNPELVETMNRMLKIGIHETSTTKDILADLALKELLLRLMQTQARALLEYQSLNDSNKNRFAHILAYIKENIHDKLEIATLAEKACMSRPNFFRKFKECMGITPNEYIQIQKIKFAKEKLIHSNLTVSEVAFFLGYQNINHFIQLFKHFEGKTPKKYQLYHQKKY
jgi:AraC-like DNA-binding protein